MPLHIGRWRWLAVAVLALLALGLASMVFSFDTDSAVAPERAREAVVAAPPPSDQGSAVAARPERAGALRGARRARRTPPSDPRATTIGAVDGSFEVLGTVRTPAVLRARSPEIRRRQMEARLDAVAAERGWSPAKTVEVKDLLHETLAGAESRLAGVANPADWAAARRDVVRFRQTQALKIAEALGEDDFRTFVGEMRQTRIPSSTGQPGVRWMPRRVRGVE